MVAHFSVSHFITDTAATALEFIYKKIKERWKLIVVSSVNLNESREKMG